MNPLILAQTLFARLRSVARALTRRGRLEMDMEAELADHLGRLTADLVAAGCPPADAARQARLAMGPGLLHKEGMRASLGLRWFDELAADLGYGLRRLRKDPAFTAIAVLSLALAIGANSAIFSVAREVLFERLHVPHPSQLRLLGWNGLGNPGNSMWGDFDSTPDGQTTSGVFSYPVYLQLRAANHVMEDLFAYKEDGMNATLRGTAQRADVAMVSGNYFQALEVQPRLGRLLGPSDDSPAAAPVAVLDYGVWERSFGASPSVLGLTVKVNQMTLTIVGVAPQRFTGAKNVIGSPGLYIPLSLQPVIDPKSKTSLLADPGYWWLNIMGRARPGVDDRTAQAALDLALQAAVRSTITLKGGAAVPHLHIASGDRGLHFADELFRQPLRILMTLTGFVLLLACANVANLLLARGSGRQREISVRLAIGAGRLRILRQLLTESLMLAALGGLAGLLLAYAARNVIPSLLTNAWEGNDLVVPFDWSVFAFTAALTLATGVLFGLAPACVAARTSVSGALKQSAQTQSRRKGRGGKFVVAFQVALSMLLVAGAGLFLRTLLALDSIPTGFSPDGLLLFQIDPPAARYPAGGDVRLHQALEQRFAALPGVESVAPGSVPYIAQNMSNMDFFPEAEPENSDRRHVEDFNVVGNAFFTTMGIPIVAGRGFGPQDTATSPKVGIINQALARKRFPNQDPIGRRFRADNQNSDWIQIVGICADTRLLNLRDQPPPQFFLPYLQQSAVGGMVYQVRTPKNAADLVPALRSVVQSIDPDLPITDIRTQRQQIEAVMQMERLFATLTSGFGVLALALACVGIYGVMAYSVAQRTNEIGIRMALGARPAQLRRMILRESSWITITGIAGGLAAAALLARLVKSMLFGIEPYDPATLMAAAVLLVAVATAATWIPARRAAKVEPVQALRYE